MARYKVTGKYEVGGAAPGQEVDLDPDKVNVDELLRVGLIEPVDQERASTVQPVDRSGQTRSKSRTTADQPESGA